MGRGDVGNVYRHFDFRKVKKLPSTSSRLIITQI